MPRVRNRLNCIRKRRILKTLQKVSQGYEGGSLFKSDRDIKLEDHL